ncbi:MAG TPA: AraC family transcriptional regulator [Anaeromyxobacter sp.]|nr:AraC family transcriptional regulator [Anaeromyxobacter sp.]
MTPDPLTDVFASVRLTGAVFFAVEGAAPWVAESPPASAILSRVMPEMDHLLEFHAVTRGHCLGGILGEEPMRLEAGDVICFPHGDPHVLSSSRGMRAPPDDLSLFERDPGTRLPFSLKLGKGPVEAHILCGFLGCDARPFNPLLKTLPRVLSASDRDGPEGGWLSLFLKVAESEARRPRPGGEAVLARLSELMFVEIVRRHLESLPVDRSGWLSGLRDPHVGKVLAVLHARPGYPWTIDALGREAGISRSTLTERFTAMVGEPPMRYLTRWRMQVAAGLLAQTHDGIAAIGARVGYASEAAFNRAFKKMVGVPPAIWRRRRTRLAAPRGDPGPPSGMPSPRRSRLASQVSLQRG